MATTIVTKSGSGAPTASDLVAGELAVDLTNKRLYTEDSGGTVLELGTNPSGNVTFGDNGKAIFGAGPELQIYSDGTTGQIAGNVNVTGSVTADGLTVDGAADINGDLEVGSAGAGTKAIVIAGSGSSTSVMDLKMFGGGTGNPTSILRHSSATKDFSILTGNSGAELTRLLVTEGGDLSLYEDTGTTPKLFWDASAESLGIGTNLPAYKLDVQGGAISAGNGTIKTGISYDTAGRLGTFSNHVLKLITNNTERMTIDDDGNVGIGVTPVTTLDVKGASDLVASFRSSTNDGNLSEAKIRAVDSDSSHVATFLFQGYEHRFQNPSGVEQMRIDSSGKLGIGTGTASPNTKVEISGARNTSELRLSSTSNDASWTVGDYIGKLSFYSGDQSGAGVGIKGSIATVAASTSGGSTDMVFSVATTSSNEQEAMRIDASGNLGIGTSSPNEALHVYNATTNVLANFESGDSKAFISFKDSSTTNTDTVFLGADGNNMAFYAGSASSERMRIDSTGLVFAAAQYTGGFGAQTTGGTLSFDDSSNARAGNGHTLLQGSDTSGPGGLAYYHVFNYEYNTKDGTGNMTQLAYGYNDLKAYMRYKFSGTWSSWVALH